MEKNLLVDSHKLMMKRNNITDLKSIRYIPPDSEEQTNRLGAHFDFGTITFQLYGDLEGLEVRILYHILFYPINAKYRLIIGINDILAWS